MKYYIIAGEASGDLHGSNLMNAISESDEQASYRCWGGDRMQQAGGSLMKHYRELAFMGFWEVITNLRVILRNIKLCKQDIIDFSPDVVILIDYPGFNLRIAEFASKAGYKVFYYISPQVWAWKSSRVKKIKKYVDRMFVILPFEEDFYQKWDYPVDYVGHPLIDALADRRPMEDFRASYDLRDDNIIALLPGSRKQEVSKILPAMVEVAEDFPEYQFVIGGLSHLGKEFYSQFLHDREISIVIDQTYDLIENAEIALVTSGTATLETALLGTPEIICYKGSWLSYTIGKWLVDIKYIALVNLILDDLVVPELIQHNLTRSALRQAIIDFQDESKRKALQTKYEELKEMLGGEGASRKVAQKMLAYLQSD